METSVTKAAKKAEHHFLNGADLSDLKDSVYDVADTIKKTSADLTKQSIQFTKKYPLHVALGACALGYIGGLLVRKMR